MCGLLRVVGPGSRFAAGAVAAIVAIGLLAAPNTVARPHDPPRQAFSVDLQAAPVDRPHSASPTAAKTLSPLATSNGIKAIALATLWYLAFPVTVPVSFLLAGWLGVYALGSDARNPKVADPWLVKAALDIFVYAPLNFISYAVTSPVSQRNTPSTVATSRHSTEFRAQGRGRHVAHGLAYSRRPAISNPIPDPGLTLHETTSSRSELASKRCPQAARSGRPTMKERSHD